MTTTNGNQAHHKLHAARCNAALRAQSAATDLRAALAAYEATGDHDHGRGPIAVGGPCGAGSDCNVRRTRELIELLADAAAAVLS